MRVPVPPEPTLVTVCLFRYIHPCGVQSSLIVVLMYISLITNDVEYLTYFFNTELILLLCVETLLGQIKISLIKFYLVLFAW